MNDTLAYYDAHADELAEDARKLAPYLQYYRFLEHVPDGGRILDFGCGTGRDARNFAKMGYEVEATDGSEELCKLASEYAGLEVRHEDFFDLDRTDCYDGLWALASILHVERKRMPALLELMARSLKKGGCMFIMVVNGDFDGTRWGRHYSDYTEDSFRELLESAGLSELEIIEAWTGKLQRGETLWLNMIIKKNA